MKDLEHRSYGECLWELGYCSVWRRLLRRDLISLYSDLSGRCSQVGVGLFSQVTSDRMRGNGLKLHLGKFRLDIKKNFSSKIVMRHWNRLSMKVVESLSLEVMETNGKRSRGETVKE